ncbi:bifunctional diaminohydroxyphosphoribosylaminopyrimidine deaminase/5-amino-6-(5-phosphoribosylamino)uracil reductase RibD [Corynebacterium imitans]|uniref:bifunctional diaminohydroxyphosphoribosylaminopyrimidine deaminase/5-amino-6-(5-phosphoribosylamino)uracil reductase RibD n=1 Tax=Corynebacterium imitans TaxID=156978 RepID=UPI0023B7DA06|nr:bifunctional diaminohydroxyphosphoribosylaminopyrimidine deaminase/5-amino-6-(5-phosphoribosylamino)uracil reductase RibD [Corynebacterium imitans]
MSNVRPHPAAVEAGIAAAISAGESVRGTTSPNPPVGCAIIDASGHLIAVGATSPAGGAHAEVNALAAAGDRAQGATAIVTLEPCAHTGRTGPCTHALIQAGVAQVIYLTKDPNPEAAGGAEVLRRAGVQVAYEPREVVALGAWWASISMQRPAVTWKYAATLDGFTAAADGTSKWITGEAARAHVHLDRARRDAIIVGTGTALADDPQLTARRLDGELYPTQPERVVVGAREITGNLARLGFTQYPDPATALAALWERGARDVLVEGGASLALSFVNAGLVDRIQAYVAPALLGAGRGVLHGPLATTISEAQRYRIERVTQLGEDVLVEMARKDLLEQDK